MTTKEIVLTSIVALIIGILLVHYEDFIEVPPQGNDSPPEPPSVSPTPSVEETPPLPSIVTPPSETAATQPSPIITQLKELVILEAAVTVTFWLDAPDKTQFSTQDRVTLYYQIEESVLANGNQRAFYFTLFNISPTGQLSILLTNEAIEANRLYALPKPRTDWQSEELSRKDTRLRLEAGNEYFKAIVTAEPIASWLKFLATDMRAQLQRQKLLGATEISVNVD